jgi:serine/threonine protein kinase
MLCIKKINDIKIGDLIASSRDNGRNFVASSNLKKSNFIIYSPVSILKYIYLKTELRLDFVKKIQNIINPIKQLPEWNQCVIKKFKSNLTILGKGSYGNVFELKNTTYPFAIKVSRIKDEHVNKKFSTCISSWHEIFILKDIIKPLIQKKICPNLPLLYDYLTCKSCKIHIDDKFQTFPCMTTIVEKADGTMKSYLKKKRSLDELYSALFQVMAGIYAIQKYGQIMNFDVKKENILYYNIQKGGVWKYTIFGKNFYIPNYGKLFVLNDFGISRSMSPSFVMNRNDEITFRLGSRMV